MNRIFFLLFCFLVFAKSNAQSFLTYGHITIQITRAKKPQNITIQTEVKTPFPGGDSSWIRLLEKSLYQAVPTVRKLRKGVYILSLYFIVDKSGYLSDVKCECEPESALCEKAVAAVHKSQIWRPAPPQDVKAMRTQ
ncbi:MAG: hypothetical protein NTW29_16585 [Bacteroidetes bacterium]|nr:hypothetical protein [Bacteroidota bacterium]